MKNIIVLLLAALNVFFYSHPPAPAAVEPAPASAPVRRAAPKLYFHSPLDAPAMSTSMNTSMGYFSADANSEFRGGYTQAVSTSSSEGSGSAGVSTGNTPLNWGDPREAADIQAIQGVYQAASLH